MLGLISVLDVVGCTRTWFAGSNRLAMNCQPSLPNALKRTNDGLV